MTNPTSAPMPKPLLSTEQLADYLGVGVTTNYRWRTNLEGPRAYRVGKYTRYRLNDVEAWLASQEIAS